MTASLIAHSQAGQGEPVLLLNGGFMTMAVWQPIAAPLEAEYRVIRCDLRGQLLSPGAAPPTLAGHVDDVVAVLDALGAGAAHVVGTSFGALVGIVMAARQPARVRSLVAATATDRYSDQEWQAAVPVVEACRAAAEGRGDGGRVVDLLTPTTYSPEFVAAHAQVLAQRRAFVSTLPPQYFAGHLGILEALHGLDVRADAAAIRCPTLVLAAEHDRTFPLERSRSLASLIPAATLDVLPGAPHGVVIESPLTVLPRIQRFLAGCARTAETRGE
jgi:pimeloyl-ACP methyl ester carboxylesterase